MCGDRMARLGDRPHQRGIALGNDAADVPDRAHLLGGEKVEEPPRAGLGPVFGPGARLEVEHVIVTGDLTNLALASQTNASGRLA